MNFTIQPAIFDLFPELKVGIIIVKNADNSGSHSEITLFLREQERTVFERVTADPITQDPRISAMREAHKKFGSKPKEYQPSAEALVRRALNKKPLPIINPLVDIYNAISLKYIMSAGGEDLDKIEGDIELVRANGDEEFIALFETKNDPPNKGEVVYKDAKGVICRRMNWREGDRTKLDKNTKNAVLVIEALSPITEDELKKALAEMSSMVEKCCKAKMQVIILSKINPIIEF